MLMREDKRENEMQKRLTWGHNNNQSGDAVKKQYKNGTLQ